MKQVHQEPETSPCSGTTQTQSSLSAPQRFSKKGQQDELMKKGVPFRRPFLASYKVPTEERGSTGRGSLPR